MVSGRACVRVRGRKMISFHFALLLVFIFTSKMLGILLYFLEFQVMSSTFIVFEMCFPNKRGYLPFAL